ncbi:hypothetical protein F2Q70_00018234 [Brassica cretica]|uniref:Uncharacterized protein n=1 Tax=Brassica cretica TaxID=69181 RepID=A0A8S9HXK6_BRACR|nr:hypothetical protein F2Q70_00018234 [Brassica cretica]
MFFFKVFINFSSQEHFSKTSPQSSSGNLWTNEEIVPKEEFEAEQEKKEAYWDALCGSITPPPEVFYPTRPATQLDPTLPSRTSPTYLKTLREFYRVPSWVVFRVPVHGESAEDPPEGFFTCYKAFLTCCRMWFPIPEAIVRVLDRFELSISQLNVAALRNFLGVLILSYELVMDLSPDDFEGLWSTRKASIDYSYRMAPKRHMSIIQGHTSNAKGWTGFRARPRFTFGFKAMRRLISFRFARWGFLPDSFRLKSATGRPLI